MRNIFTLSSVATCGNLAAGFSALVFAAQADFFRAAILVGVAAVFDALDGVIARKSDADTEFGANLDSLADIVSFGAAPAFALFLASLNSLGSLGVAACAAFVVCGAARLARFPLVKNGKNFLGLPIPPAGVALAALAMAEPSAAVALAAAVSLGILMVTDIPFPTLASILSPKERERSPREE